MWTDTFRRLLLAGCVFLLASHGLSAQAPAAKRNVGDANPAAQPASATGSYYALVIGNQDYEHVKGLATPAQDALEIASLLHYDYGFTARVLLNATRRDILEALVQYRRTLAPESNLLIYYAGHGAHDKDTDEAYWLPVDAKPADNTNWISADDITSNIKAMPSLHVIVISDSCYSGALKDSATRAIRTSIVPVEADRFFARVLRDRSRTILSSGGDEPVMDAGGTGHSVFAQALLDGLRKMDGARFTASELYDISLRRRVAGQSDQIPYYSPLPRSGDLEGDFVFARASTPSSLSFDYKSIVANWDHDDLGSAAKSVENVRKAAKQGNVPAMLALANLYTNVKRLKKDDTQAVFWWKKAVDVAKNPEAMTALGLAYKSGVGVQKDLTQMNQWLSQAAPNDVLAQYTLGSLFYEEGNRDDGYAKAQDWFRRSADLGFGPSMAALGEMYLLGRGVRQDHFEAARWFRRSLHFDTSPTLIDMPGPEYDLWKDTLRLLADHEGALKQSSAIRAMKGLATMYEGGLSLHRSRSVALDWYKKAAALGDQEAEAAARRLEAPPTKHH